MFSTIIIIMGVAKVKGQGYVSIIIIIMGVAKVRVMFSTIIMGVAKVRVERGQTHSFQDVVNTPTNIYTLRLSRRKSLYDASGCSQCDVWDVADFSCTLWSSVVQDESTGLTTTSVW